MSCTGDSLGGPEGKGNAQPARLRILFVDDEEMVLRMLRAAVASMAGQWEAAYAGSGQEALDLLRGQTFDMVVSDMRMPGMNGAELLNEVFRLYPATFRVILTGFVEQSHVMETVGTAHQFLSKPFELNRLKELLKRAGTLRDRLSDPKLRQIVAQTGCVPVVPRVYFEILSALQNPECDIEGIAKIVATDPGLTSKILQLVNSAFFGLASPIAHPAEAVMVLGTGMVRSLALSDGVFSAFPAHHAEGFSVEHLWGHSVRVARLAERICRFEHADAGTVEQAFTGGLLHDVGKLMLAHSLPSEYPSLLNRAAKENRPLTGIESATLKATHAEIGACLLQLWGLPAPLVETVLWHEQPESAPADGVSPLIAVGAANILDHQSSDDPANPAALETGWLDRLGLQACLERWRQHCLEP